MTLLDLVRSICLVEPIAFAVGKAHAGNGRYLVAVAVGSTLGVTGALLITITAKVIVRPLDRYPQRFQNICGIAFYLASLVFAGSLGVFASYLTTATRSHG
jgi:hypothetical protein